MFTRPPVRLALALAIIVIALLAQPASAQTYPAAEYDTIPARQPEAHAITCAASYAAGNTILTCTVASDPALNDISHVVVKACLPAYVSSTGCPGAVTTGYDPTTGFTGVKCDGGGSYTWSMTFAGTLLPVDVDQGAAIKYGPATAVLPATVVSCEPQAVTVDWFRFDGRAFTWLALEDGLFWWVTDKAGRQVTPTVPAQSPGNWGYFLYAVHPSARYLPPGLYILWATDVHGQTDHAAEYIYNPWARDE